MKNLPGAGLAFVPQRTARFAVGSWLRAKVPPTDGRPPDPRLSLGLTMQVAIDEALLGFMKSPRRFPESADYAVVAKELEEAAALYSKRGWAGDPASYHRDPGVPSPVSRRGWNSGLSFERLSWPSAYRPHRGEPGAARWMGYAANRTAHAWMLRGDPERPWLVCLHGFGTGQPVSDFFAFRARRMHRDLGLNLLFPVLPIHGPRKIGRLGGIELMGYQLQNFTLGMAQAMVDVRGLIRWARTQGAERIGVYGMSLGGYTAGLLSTFDEELDFVLAGAPFSDVASLYEHHATPTLRKRFDPDGTLGEVGRVVHQVVSPLSRPATLPAERLAIFAGLGDRMAPPSQAQRLWEHWGNPRIEWYEGSHITFVWSGAVARFVEDSLRAAGFVRRWRTPRPAPTAAPAGGTPAPGPRRARS